jgi:hypothetical protein
MWQGCGSSRAGDKQPSYGTSQHSLLGAKARKPKTNSFAQPAGDTRVAGNEVDYFVCRCRWRNSGLVVENR